MNTHVHKDISQQQPQLSDDQLLSQARSGDRQALGELCMRHNVMLKNKISSILRHQEDTEDVIQDTFLSVYRHLHAFRETCKFSTWLIRIGINTSLMLLRKRKRLSETVTNEFDMLELQDPTPDPEQEYLTDQTRLALSRAIQELPPPHAACDGASLQKRGPHKRGCGNARHHRSIGKVKDHAGTRHATPFVEAAKL
jgi:RNA polymerase sigma-70 factor, ECF subfamily